MLVLVRRLLLIKMRKIQYAFLVVLALFVLFYLLPRSDRDTNQIVLESLPGITLPNDRVHIFYDASYRNEKTDQAFHNWYKRQDEGPLDSAYYPKLGIYSSNDPIVVDAHMQQIQSTGVGVVVVSWWPNDHKNSPPMSLILEHAQKYGLKVTIHVQNYPNRTLGNLIENVISVLKIYSNHPAFYKLEVLGRIRPLPLIYINEPLAFKPDKWSLLLNPADNRSIRGTKFDALFIGLIIHETDRYLLENSGFDGFYTMLSLVNHAYASTWYYWPYIQDFVRERNMIFIPTVSPGYDYRMSKRHVNPLLVPPLVSRSFGDFYHSAWTRAIICRSKFVVINSFNGWLTGTQIEPAEDSEVVYSKLEIRYEDYSPGTGEEYLEITRKWVIEFSNRSLYRSL